MFAVYSSMGKLRSSGNAGNFDFCRGSHMAEKTEKS